jgi:hypothetical protein
VDDGEALGKTSRQVGLFAAFQAWLDFRVAVIFTAENAEGAENGVLPRGNPCSPITIEFFVNDLGTLDWSLPRSFQKKAKTLSSSEGLLRGTNAVLCALRVLCG